jgi:ribosomal-protein-alanine N-acetyltransferase
MKLKIRKGLVSDAEAMARLDARCFDESIRYSKSIFTDLLKSPSVICHVAQRGPNDQSICGFILAETSFARAPCGHIITIDVDPKCHRMGLGTVLLEKVHQAMLKKGLEKMVLEVYTQNLNAIEFYQARNYRIITTVRDYYGTGKDAYLMLNELDQAKE